MYECEIILKAAKVMGNLVNKQTILEKQNMSEDLITYIKQQILDGTLNPGDRIIETKLAKDLSISQTPVREAIRQLSGEGILNIVPNKGPVVRSLDMTDVFEIYSIRSMLEGLAIRLTTQKASQDDILKLCDFYSQMKEKLQDDKVDSLLAESQFLHKSIIKLADHSLLTSMYQSINFKILLVNRIMGNISTKEKEVEQHWELIDALMRRDPNHAEATMRKHIYRSYLEFTTLQGVIPQEDKGLIWFN